MEDAVVHPASRIHLEERPAITIDVPRVVILTAVEVEFDAVLAHLPQAEETRCGSDGAIYERALLRTTAGNEWELFVRRSGRGNNAASKEALDSLRRLSPQLMLFVGVAGGLKDVRLGDVVVAESVGQYDVGKVVSQDKGAVGQLLPRGSIHRPDPELLDRARQEAWTGRWVERIHSARAIPTRKTPPKAIVEPIVSGEKVIAELKSYEGEQLRLLASQAVAVEMEGFGFLHALHDKPVKSLVIRGISDLVSDKAPTHDAKWQPIASATAAA